MAGVWGRRGIRITARFGVLEGKWSWNFPIKGKLSMGAATWQQCELSKNNDQTQLARYFGKAFAEKKRKGPWEVLWTLFPLQPRMPCPVLCTRGTRETPACISDHAQRIAQKSQAGSLL